MVAELARRFPTARLLEDATGTSAEAAAVVDFVEAPVRNINLPLDIHGTDFQRQVYREVLTIPFGQTTTFADIAARSGSTEGRTGRWQRLREKPTGICLTVSSRAAQ